MDQATSTPSWADRLPGGMVIWVFVCVELLTFAMFFLAYASQYGADPVTFNASQVQLHPASGAVNTAVLLTGSWFAARGVIAHRGGTATRWFALAAAAGLLFTAIKLNEYVDVFGLGVNMSTNGFWFFYLFLTVFHLAHVLVGVGVMGWVAVAAKRDQVEASTVEAAAVYWHLVDLIWIVLFPALYLVHP